MSATNGTLGAAVGTISPSSPPIPTAVSLRDAAAAAVNLALSTPFLSDDATYVFPRDKLAREMKDPSKTPLAIVACGSYSPVTYLHLRMFEMMYDFIEDHGEFELIGAYFSPVSSGYKRNGLADCRHRVRMCELAVADSTFIMVDRWEACRPDAERTSVVLQHFDDCINGGVSSNPDEWGVLCNGKRRQVRIMLLAGGDLIESFAKIDVIDGVKVPLWAPADLDVILGKYGCIIIERTGSNVHDFLIKHQKLYDHR
ncbi:hypothetical protein HK405_014773, partial [Cladochytrium tenue]